jgi:hypothetical protein
LQFGKDVDERIVVEFEVRSRHCMEELKKTKKNFKMAGLNPETLMMIVGKRSRSYQYFFKDRKLSPALQRTGLTVRMSVERTKPLPAMYQQ